MEDEINIRKPKKSGKKKLIIGGAILLAGLYVAEKARIVHNAGTFFGNIKDGIVDVLTTDTGEAASGLVEKLRKTKNINAYVDDVKNAAYTAASRLPDYDKKRTLVRILKESSKDVKDEVFSYAGSFASKEAKGTVIRKYAGELSVRDSRFVKASVEKNISALEKTQPKWYDKILDKVSGAYKGVKKKVFGEKKKTDKKVEEKQPAAMNNMFEMHKRIYENTNNFLEMQKKIYDMLGLKNPYQNKKKAGVD